MINKKKFCNIMRTFYIKVINFNLDKKVILEIKHFKRGCSFFLSDSSIKIFYMIKIKSHWNFKVPYKKLLLNIMEFNIV